MNKAALISFVRASILRREAVADNQGKLHYQRVAQAVNYAFNTMLSQMPMTRENKAKVESYYVKHRYAQPVKEANGYRYFGVSDELIPVGEGRGVWYVQPSADEPNAGRPLSHSNRPSISMYNNLKIGKAINDTVWRFGNLGDTRQIVLESVGTSPIADIRKVDFGVVRALSSYGEDEEVFVDRTDLIVQLSTEWLQGAYQDLENNNQ